MPAANTAMAANTKVTCIGNNLLNLKSKLLHSIIWGMSSPRSVDAIHLLCMLPWLRMSACACHNEHNYGHKNLQGLVATTLEAVLEDPILPHTVAAWS